MNVRRVTEGTIRSFADMRASRERESLWAGGSPASLEASNRAPGTEFLMDLVRALTLYRLGAWGLGAVREVAAPTPSLVPRACNPGQRVRFIVLWKLASSAPPDPAVS